MKTFKLISLGILAILAACSPDPDPGMEESNFIETLKKNKWVYSYVEDWTDTSYGGYYGAGNITLYFLDNNVGYGFQVHRDYDTGLGNSTDEYSWKFTYSISGNKVTCGNTTYTYIGGYLVDGRDYYEPSKMTQSDRERLAHQDISSNMKNYVKVTSKLIEDSLIYYFTIDQEKLRENYPLETSLNVQYYIDYQYECYKDEYYSTELNMLGKGKETFRLSLLFGGSDMYMQTYKNIRVKIDRGEELTESEKELFEACIEYVRNCLNTIRIRIYAYYKKGIHREMYDFLDEYPSVNVELDSSYN